MIGNGMLRAIAIDYGWTVVIVAIGIAGVCTVPFGWKAMAFYALFANVAVTAFYYLFVWMHRH